MKPWRPGSHQVIKTKVSFSKFRLSSIKTFGSLPITNKYTINATSQCRMRPECLITLCFIGRQAFWLVTFILIFKNTKSTKNYSKMNRSYGKLHHECHQRFALFSFHFVKNVQG